MVSEENVFSGAKNYSGLCQPLRREQDRATAGAIKAQVLHQHIGVTQPLAGTGSEPAPSTEPCLPPAAALRPPTKLLTFWDLLYLNGRTVSLARNPSLTVMAIESGTGLPPLCRGPAMPFLPGRAPPSQLGVLLILNELLPPSRST